MRTVRARIMGARACARALGARGADLHAQQKKTIRFDVLPKHTSVLFKKAASYTHFWNLIFSKKTKIKKKTGFVILMKTPCQWDFAVL